MEEQAKKLSELLKVLSNEYRLIILCLLMEKSQTVSSLEKSINKISQSAISQHLSILKAHGVVDSEKQGLHVTYSISDERIKNVIEILKLNYC